MLVVLDPDVVAKRSVAVTQIHQEIRFAVFAPSHAIVMNAHSIRRGKRAGDAIV